MIGAAAFFVKPEAASQRPFEFGVSTGPAFAGVAARGRHFPWLAGFAASDALLLAIIFLSIVCQSLVRADQLMLAARRQLVVQPPLGSREEVDPSVAALRRLHRKPRPPPRR